MKLNNKKIKADNIVLNELERLSKIENNDLFASELDKFIEKSKRDEFYDGQDEINLEAEGLPNVVMYDGGRKFKYVNGRDVTIHIKKGRSPFIEIRYNNKIVKKTVRELYNKYYGDFGGWINLEHIDYPNYWCNTEKGLIKNKFGELIGFITQDGYVEVWLCNNSKQLKIGIHRIVAHLVYGMDLYDSNIHVNHLNEKRSDNRACNLRPGNAINNINWSIKSKNEFTRVTETNGKYHYLIYKGGFNNEEEANNWKLWAFNKLDIEYLKEGFKEPINRDKEWVSLDIIGEPDYVINKKGNILNISKYDINNHTEDNYMGLWKKKFKSGNIYYMFSASRKTFLLHNVLAKCFIHNPDPEKYTNCDHIDNNGLNYDLNNLQWTTGRHNGTKDSKRECKYPNIRKNGKKYHVRFLVGYFNTPEEAAKARKEAYELLGLEYVCKSEFKEEKENLK